MSEPIANGENGRDTRGRFAKGNPGGPGNPRSKQVADFRRVLAESVTESDLRAVAKALVLKAKDGDVAAAKELFDRLLGKAPASVATTVDVRTTREAGYPDYGGLSPDKLARLAELDELIHKPIPALDSDVSPDLRLSNDPAMAEEDEDGLLRQSA